MAARICYECRRYFDGRKDARFCSDRCRLKRWRALGMGPRKIDVWTALGEQSARKCEHCGELLWRPGMHWPRANKRYCSDRCRIAAHRRKGKPE
jgi:predicted nucleic acid-binding Zn ribbon protein